MFDAAGDPLLVVSQAAVRHDGSVRSGVIDPKHGLDNYVGELGALLQALEDAEAGCRIALKSLLFPEGRHSFESPRAVSPRA